ncbi:MAG: hypothetical protein KDD89_04005 [Anaerolineales bacterium]|nr:hypothetical protein [Anaerolineales bacterium]
MITLNGSQIIRATPPTVWQFLTTPEVVTPLVPQVRRWRTTQTAPHEFEADLAFVWAGQTILFPSKITWYNEVAQKQAALLVAGCSGESGFTAETKMCLRASFGLQTEVLWDVTAVLQGKLADIPPQLTKAAALLAINQFFRAVRTELTTTTTPKPTPVD